MPGQGADVGTVVLPTRLDTMAVHSLLATLQGMHGQGTRGQGLQLDAACVEQVGGLCLQVLLAAKATWEADGRTFEVSAPSAAMRSALELFGLQSLTHQRNEGVS